MPRMITEIAASMPAWLKRDICDAFDFDPPIAANVSHRVLRELERLGYIEIKWTGLGREIANELGR